jgi:activator of HSP90 ATPase
MRTIAQSVLIKASPHDVYEALMDSKKHSEFTGSKAVISRKAGGQFVTWDGYAEGKNVTLVPDSRIAQSWRASDWPPGLYSYVRIKLDPIASGTRLTFLQSDVPDEFKETISKGWRDFYWTPLKRMLEAKQ